MSVLPAHTIALLMERLSPAENIGYKHCVPTGPKAVAPLSCLSTCIRFSKETRNQIKNAQRTSNKTFQVPLFHPLQERMLRFAESVDSFQNSFEVNCNDH